MGSKGILEELFELDRQCGYLRGVASVLRWDQETCLPKAGVAERSCQISLIERHLHERFTASRTGKLLEALGSRPDNPGGDEGLSDLERDFLRVTRRAYDRAVKVPPDFVAQMSRAAALSQAAWERARRNNDFALFLPHLREMIDYSRRLSEYWGFYGEACYDGLLDVYEPGMGAARIGSLFEPLGEALQGLLRGIGPKADGGEAFTRARYDVEDQRRFNDFLLDYLGFDKSRGRLDVSAHPFTTTLGRDDVRVTTRYFEDNQLSGMFSVIHETGHAFYELGFPAELWGSRLAEGASMAVHESQSRLWENIVGRSGAFWRGLFPHARKYFPVQLGSVDAEGFYRAVNRVRPSLIRVDADEVSYGLHIILRFDLERRLISGVLDPADVPGAWRELSLSYLGIAPDTDAEGALQDVHWSMGSFGYFPSYALGNLYAAQIAEKLKEDIPQFDTLVEAGRFGEIRSWLAEKVYRWGARLEPACLLEKICGEKLSARPFLDYLENKYKAIYGL